MVKMRFIHHSIESAKDLLMGNRLPIGLVMLEA